MKFRIGYMVTVFFAMVLSGLAQTTHLTLTGASFICANQVVTGNCPNAEFDPALGSIQNPQGTWAATVTLPQGAVVSALRLCGNFNEVGSSITATLDRTPVTASSGFPSPVAMASVQSTGAANKTQCFKTTTITDATIDNGKNQYYVVVNVPDNDGVIFTIVQIEY
ncbi:MAG TPA: hypothetical protein VEI52_25380 [Terriglobales bacterium]|nr:hypothetical protein [Terriglobales bacterium]